MLLVWLSLISCNFSLQYVNNLVRFIHQSLFRQDWGEYSWVLTQEEIPYTVSVGF